MARADANSPQPATGSGPAPRLLRFIIRTLARLAAIFGLAILSLSLLAGGGAQPFVWLPPATPTLDASGTASFDVTVSPATADVDVPISIAVAGLDPGASVVLIMSTTDARGVLFESWGRFEADDQGRLSVDDTVPEAATYLASSSNGLLWSMRAANGSAFHTSKQWQSREYRLRVISNGAATEVEFRRRYPFSDVSHKIVGGEAWRGELTVPGKGDSFPVIIVLGGWDDGPMPLTSALLSRHGYAVLNLGYHGWDGLPEDLVEIPVESVTAAIDWLDGQGGFDTGGIGMLGFSKGAELALITASRDARITATAAWAPGSEVFPGISFRSVRQRSSWSWHGQPLPFARAPLDRDAMRVIARLLLGRPVSFRPVYAAALASSDGESAIPVEKINGEVLLMAGARDLIWPSTEMSSKIEARIEALGGPEVRTFIFDDAGHSMRFALWPDGDFSERQLIRGGTPEANHRAGQFAWQATLEFFDRLLLDRSSGE